MVSTLLFSEIYFNYSTLQEVSLCSFDVQIPYKILNSIEHATHRLYLLNGCSNISCRCHYFFCLSSSLLEARVEPSQKWSSVKSGTLCHMRYKMSALDVLHLQYLVQIF